MKPIFLLLLSFFTFTYSMSAQIDCVPVNLEIYCVDTTSNEYYQVIMQDDFCCSVNWDNFCLNQYNDLNGPPLPDCDPNSGDISGCTDPAALNYNSNATLDDGSCFYSDSCNTNEAIILLSTQNWGNEISWNLSLDDQVVAGGGNYTNYSSTTHFACLEDGCYTLEMMDSFGDGWNGGIISITINGNEIVNTSLLSGNYNYLIFGVNSAGCDTLMPIYGCTDPDAVNYNPNATVDDGSCLNSQVDNDICEDASPLQEGTHLISNIGAVTNAGVWGECWAFGNGEGEQSSIWFSFTTPEEPASIFIEATPDGSNTFTDTQFGLFETCGGEMIHCDGNAGPGLFSAFHFECGELEENTEYILMIDGYFGDVGTCFLTYEVTLGCPEVEGCTDPAAYNYNPLATLDNGTCMYVDSCASNLVELHINTANWGDEISWNLLLDSSIVISGDGYADFSNYTSILCLEDGCYTFEMFDSFGDGWNGASYSFTEMGTNTVLNSGTLSSGQYGTATFGLNTECQEECGNLSFEFIPFGDPALGCVISTEATYTGDDQNGTLVWDFGAGTPPLTGNGWGSGFQYSANGSYNVCVTYTTANCTLTYCDTFIATDCGPQEIYGCTDPNAINYNPNATVNDGSCQYADSCLTNLALLQINTEMWGAEISWSLLNNGNEVASGDGYANYETYNHWICLDNGCYTIELYDSFGDGWNGGEYIVTLNGNVLAAGTLSSGEFGSATFGVNEVCEDEIYGCTDPAAINYNPTATIDDGSCEYDITCVEVGESYCVDNDSEAYYITVTQDPFCCNTQWDQICQDAYVGYGGPLGEDCDIYGCTDPNADNYNPNATIDDGSCEYEFECGISFTVTPDSTGAQVIWITPSDNIFNAVEVLWDFGDGNTSTDLFPSHIYAGDGPYLLCLTALFADPNSNDYCSITFCAELTNEMINPPGFQSSGFSINVVNPGTVTNIEQDQQITDVNLWPNPTNQFAQLEWTMQTSENVTIALFDLSGKQAQAYSLAASPGKNLYTIDAVNLPPGMYVVRIIGQAYQSTTKLIKN